MPDVEGDMSNMRLTKEGQKIVWTVEASGKVPAHVVEHVRNNIVPAQEGSSKCVDGGYRPGEAEGQLARPGADLGLSMLLLSFSIFPADSFKRVMGFRASNSQKYGWHTDQHADPVHNEDGDPHSSAERAICGCGHCVMASKQHEKYFIADQGAVEELLSIIRSNNDSNPDMFNFVNLDRDHEESGVLVVSSMDYTIAPWEIQKSQFFVYDALRDDLLLEELYASLSVDLELPFTLEEFKNRASSHTSTTLGLLKSSQGKSIYTVDIQRDDHKIKIALAGTVESA